MANPFSNLFRKVPPTKAPAKKVAPKQTSQVRTGMGGTTTKPKPKLQTYTPPKKISNLFGSLAPNKLSSTPPKARPIPANKGSKNTGIGVEGGLSAGITYGNTWGTTPFLGRTTQPVSNSGGGGGGGYGGYYGGGGGGGGDGGGGGTPAEISWAAFDSGVQGAPAWWKALKPSEVNEGTEFLASLNLLIPFLSPEDQRSVASTLYSQDAKNFGHLSPEKIGVDNPAISEDMQKYFTSSDRAVKALAALEKLAGATGKNETSMGKGYRYLRSILSAVKSYGAGAGENNMTRANMTSLYSTLDPLLNQAKTEELGAYGPLATMLSKPFFTKGNLMPIGKTQDGRYIFGEANKALL